MPNPTSSPSPSAAVIIPHYNDPMRLQRCLQALAASNAAEDLDRVEIVVVDNASPCDLSHLQEAFPNIRFLTEPAKGAAHARNSGVAATTARRLAFIDADCVPSPGWLDHVLNLSLPENNGVVGGKVDTFDETPPPRSGAEAFERVFAFDFRHYIEKMQFTGSGNMVTSRATFETVGPFRPGLSEDVDWSRRAIAAGFTIAYDEALEVSHPTRQDWAALKTKWRRTTQEGFLLRGTGLKARLLWALRAFAVLGSVPVHLPRILRSKKLDSTGERLRGALTLLRLRVARAGWMLLQAISKSPQP